MYILTNLIIFPLLSKGITISLMHLTPFLLLWGDLQYPLLEFLQAFLFSSHHFIKVFTVHISENVCSLMACSLLSDFFPHNHTIIVLTKGAVMFPLLNTRRPFALIFLYVSCLLFPLSLTLLCPFL